MKQQNVQEIEVDNTHTHTRAAEAVNSGEIIQTELINCIARTVL